MASAPHHASFAPALLKYLPPGIAEMMKARGAEALPKVRAILRNQ